MSIDAARAAGATIVSMRYSVFKPARQRFSPAIAAGSRAWREPEPKPAYDVVIVGGGGHGLATAYYLAKEHGITNVAVLEKGWIGSRQRRAQHHHHPLQLPAARQHPVLRMVDEAVGGAGAGPQLQRHGQPARRAEPLSIPTPSATPIARRGNAMRLHGVDAELLDREQVRATACRSSISTTRAFRSRAACCSARGGTARHDAVAWGYARGADRRGVDIIQNCEVTGHSRRRDGRVTGVETTRGSIRASKVGARRAPATPRASRRMAGLAPADREPRAAGLRLRRR